MVLNIRNNNKSTAAVVQGILLDHSDGAAIAWAYMAHNDIPPKVILRVLTDVKRRRPEDPASVMLDEKRARRVVICHLVDALLKQQADEAAWR